MKYTYHTVYIVSTSFSFSVTNCHFHSYSGMGWDLKGEALMINEASCSSYHELRHKHRRESKHQANQGNQPLDLSLVDLASYN